MRWIQKSVVFVLCFALMSCAIAAVCAAVIDEHLFKGDTGIGLSEEEYEKELAQREPDDRFVRDGKNDRADTGSSAFVPRLTAPAKTNKFYYSDYNPFYKYGYGMPNCTAYAFGRVYEYTGSLPDLCLYDAHLWFEWNKETKHYKYGQTARLGAVACWEYSWGGSGHVAVVEKIEKDVITFSNSAYSTGVAFYTHTAPVMNPSGDNDYWIFQGYIYPDQPLLAGQTVSAGNVLATPKFTKAESGANGVDLAWRAIAGAEKYRVFLKENGGWKKLADTYETSFTDIAARSGETRTYTVRCLSDDGKYYMSGFLADGITVDFCPTPVLKSAVNQTDGVLLTWGKVEGVSQYRVYRKIGSGSWNVLTGASAVSYLDKSVKSGVTYTYTVRCLSDDGKRTISSYDKTGIATEYLSVPKLTKIENIYEGVALTWEKVTGAKKYRVFVKEDQGWRVAGDTASVTFTDTTASSGYRHTYTVRCISENGKTFLSGFDATGLTIRYVAAPKLSPAEITSRGIKISWSAVAGIKEYQVYRKTEGSSWEKLPKTEATSLADNSVKTGVTYTYTVRCLASDGKTPVSGYYKNGKSAVMLAFPTITKAQSGQMGVDLEWKAVTGAYRYRVFVKEGTTWTVLGDTLATKFTHGKAISGRSYTYTVRCVTANGQAYASGYDSVGKTVRYVAAPVVTTLSNTSSGIFLRWNAVSGTKVYRVFRKTAGGAWEKLIDTAAVSVTDRTAKSGVTYRYTVRCLDDTGKNYVSSYFQTIAIKCAR